VRNDRLGFPAARMGADQWTALLVAIAGVLAGLAAIPATEYRPLVLTAATALVLLALTLGAWSQRSSKPSFTITSPTADQGVSGRVVIVSGTIGELDSDTLWVFEEGLVEGRRAWFFGGEAFVNGSQWTYEYEPDVGLSDKVRRTLSVVKADRNCERQLRSIKPDVLGRLVVNEPVPGGCEVLGQVSIVLPVPP
jgi:hypothetical protein